MTTPPLTLSRRTTLTGLAASALAAASWFVVEGALRRNDPGDNGAQDVEVDRWMTELEQRFASNDHTLKPENRAAMLALLSIYVKRDDLQAVFPDPVKANFDGLLSWATTDNDYSTTSLISHRTQLRRIRLIDLSQPTPEGSTGAAP